MLPGAGVPVMNWTYSLLAKFLSVASQRKPTVSASSNGSHRTLACAGAAAMTSATNASRPILRTTLSTIEENGRAKLLETEEKTWLMDRMPCKK